MTPGFKRRAVTVICVMIALPFVGLAVAWSGVFDVSAHRGHYPFVEPIIRLVMERSVALRAPEEIPDLNEPDLARLGAKHFALNCAPCHGAPGQLRNPVVEQMMPPPPDLATRRHFDSAELFWIVRNGLKYTGMPGWSAYDRPDEVWTVVAFLNSLPGMPPETYAELSGDGEAGEETSLRRLAAAPTSSDGFQRIETTCIRCHGSDGGSHGNVLVPRLDILTRRTFIAAMEDFGSGLRTSGIMEPVARGLDRETLGALAETFAEHTQSEIPEFETENVETQELIRVGAPERGIPACQSCHAQAGGSGNAPRLSGQRPLYLARQLHLFRSEVRSGTSASRLMASAAKNLTDREIDALAQAYGRSAAAPAEAATGNP